jgi:uncharacterized membrane protein
MRLSAPYILVLLAAVLFMAALIEVGVITIAFDRLGISPHSGLLLLLASLVGSGINIPVYLRSWKTPERDLPTPLESEVWGFPRRWSPGSTLIAVNVGGCLIPVGVCLSMLLHHTLGIGAVLTSVAVVTAVSYLFSRPVAGRGIAIPVFVAPLVSAVVASLLDPEHSAPLAYIGGTMGVLIGADLLRLPDIDRLHTPIASIGGAGTFDGIFFTGIIAALLA